MIDESKRKDEKRNEREPQKGIDLSRIAAVKKQKETERGEL